MAVVSFSLLTAQGFSKRSLFFSDFYRVSING